MEAKRETFILNLAELKYSAYFTAYLLLNQIFRTIISFKIIDCTIQPLMTSLVPFPFPLRDGKGKSNIPQLLPEYHQETEGFLPFSKGYLIRIILQKIIHSVKTFY